MPRFVRPDSLFSFFSRKAIHPAGFGAPLPRQNLFPAFLSLDLLRLVSDSCPVFGHSFFSGFKFIMK